MIRQTFNDFELSPFAIRNREFKGFEQDYLILDSLLRTHKPDSVFEVGTNFGTGTNIICNAVPNARVYSLELPYGEGDKPLIQNGKDMTGVNCKFPFTQLRGDSTKFGYFYCDAFFVDAGHFYDNVFAETTAILKLKPKLVVYHDSDIPEVFKAIHDANTDYKIHRVTDTRITYLL